MSARPSPTVLVCDDDAAMREVVCAILQARGYRSLEASSGEQAIELARAERPAVLLLDLLMPGLSGWETAAMLRANAETASIPIVILSVLAADAARPSSKGLAGWIRKPLDAMSLFEVLDRAVGRDAQGARVLIVEDDEDLAMIVRAMFERHGLETFRAATGESAIELSEELDPDVLVLDLALPGADGFAVVDWLRRHDRLRHVALIVYTARDLGAAERDRLRLGSRTAFLTKGRISPQDFEHRVMQLLGQLVTDRKGLTLDGAEADPGR